MSLAGEFSFGEGDSGVGQKFKSFKGEAGRTYRVSFGWYPVKDGKFDLTVASPKFAGQETHYIPGVGYVINKGPEYTKLAGEAPKQRIGTILVLWPTDKNGNLDKARLQTDYEVLPWIFSGDKFNQLKAIHTEFNFGSHDVKINCTDAQFQKMTFTPCNESLLASINEKVPAVRDAIAGAVAALTTKMAGQIGREMTIAQIREKLAGGGGGGGGGGGSAGLAANSGASGQIDDIVDNLLDA